MNIEFETSGGDSYDIEILDGNLFITDEHPDSCTMIPLKDLNRFIHELQIIANEYPCKKA